MGIEEWFTRRKIYLEVDAEENILENTSENEQDVEESAEAVKELSIGKRAAVRRL